MRKLLELLFGSRNDRSKDWVKGHTDEDLLRIVNGYKSIFFGGPSKADRKLSLQELLDRGHNQEWIEKEISKVRKRENQGLSLEIWVVNILLPKNEFYKADIERFSEYGFKKKVEQDFLSRMIGIFFWILIFSLIIIYSKFFS